MSLTDAGHVVVEASDGTKASALLRETVFDVIVSDVRLPGVDGLTLLRTVRRDAPLTDFILMTAFADVGQAVAALKEGASDYLMKPFDVDELLHHIWSHRQHPVDAARARRGAARAAAAFPEQPARGPIRPDVETQVSHRDDRARATRRR